jgi:hypothetical protein
MRSIACLALLLLLGLAGAALAAGEVRDWPLPAPAGSAQPDLVADARGRIWLSWIEAVEGGHQLRLARYDSARARWDATTTIARGSDWFVNWADTPHVIALGDGSLYAHWLRKSAQATYAYDVWMARSVDGGAHWSEPWRVNTDGTPTEHGFVALWLQARDRVGIAWLDGRHTGGGEHAGHDGHGGGMMSLRAAVYAGGRRQQEWALDASTCDCCQTAAAMTADGPLVAYRDRTADEIRDIYVTRLSGSGWSAPARVHADQWRMPACPVNGPALAVRGREAWVAWYTMADGQPRARLARSADGGRRFSPPVELAAGPALQGRLVLAQHGPRLWAAWTMEDTQGQRLELQELGATDLRPRGRQVLARLEGRGRATGFAQLVATEAGLFAVWTDVREGRPRLRGARVMP